MSRAERPRATWSPQRLVRRLSRSGWGEHRSPATRGAFRTLAALADHIVDDVRHPSAETARITVWQLAQRTGYQERWTRTCLAWLEEIGLIVWNRGRWQGDQPRPSLITIQRAPLAALVQDALHCGDKRTQAHCQAIRDKIKEIGSPRFLQSRRKTQPAATATLPPPGRGVERPSGHSERERRTGRRTHRDHGPKGWRKFLPLECHPFGRDPATCPHCKTTAIAALKTATGAEDGAVSPPQVVHPSGLFSILEAIGRLP